ncbi:hypothetical protein RND71_030565 [Anisodus tanguticus]|uniref:Uncharacterized protein n=1 Tax=Anisodus tanguticus TaxID=243964 RepID=A0AAE1RHZ0_9SOLA|nr:hypothetical protein RND71_030565 [Anisodus tanguticus]
MLQEIIKVHEFKSKRLRFGNTLTAYLLRIDDNLPKSSDRILPGPEDMLDISIVKAPELNVKHISPPPRKAMDHSEFATLRHGFGQDQGRGSAPGCSLSSIVVMTPGFRSLPPRGDKRRPIYILLDSKKLNFMG